MRRVLVLVLAALLLGGCRGKATDTADPTAPVGAGPTTIVSTGCPNLPAPTATVEASTAAGDFDGDGRPDRLVTGRVGAGGAWKVRMELAAGGGAETELPAGAEGVKAIGGAQLDVGPAQAAFAAVGRSAAGPNVGLFVLRACKVERVTLAGQPAELAVRTGAESRAGVGCQGPGLVAYAATSSDGRFYQARTTSYLLVGLVLDEVHRAASMLGADDPALAPYSTFRCGPLSFS